MHMPEVFWHMSLPTAQDARISDRQALTQTKKFLKKEEKEEKEEEEENRTLLLRLRCPAGRSLKIKTRTEPFQDCG